MTNATYVVPVDHTGATDVYRAINDWLLTVPNGSVIDFPQGTYKLSQGIKLGGRNNFVFRGNGSTLLLIGSGSDYQASGFVLGWGYTQGYWTGGSSHIAISGFTVVGNDPTPGTLGGGENQHAFDVHSGSSFVEISNVTVRAVYGDGIFSIGSNDVWYHDIHVETAGRNGVSHISGFRSLTEQSVFDRVGYCTFDIEPNFSTEASSDVTFRNSTAGTWQNGIGLISVDGAANGPSIVRITFSGITTTGMAPQVYIDNKTATTRMRDATVANVRGPAGGTIRIIDVDGVVVYGNTPSLTLTGSTNIRLAP